MNPQLMQRIDEKLARLSEQHIAEVLDFVEFLESRAAPVSIQLNQSVKMPPSGRLSALHLDLTGYKFNREEANER